jgi:hypothetical protein
MTSFRAWLTGSLLAVLACALPWLTHFADGSSILLLVLWLASIVVGPVRFRWA